MCSIGGCAEANESIKCVVAKPKNILKRSCTECVYSSFRLPYSNLNFQYAYFKWMPRQFNFFKICLSTCFNKIHPHSQNHTIINSSTTCIEQTGLLKNDFWTCVNGDLGTRRCRERERIN
ncbi:hypothetical protein AAZV13_06G058000 [Glycine max]